MARGIEALETRIGYSFRDKTLLRRALIHPSYSSEMKMERCESNQRLEFLGDAVLELVTSRYLYDRYPGAEEGDLTRMRASLVYESALSDCARNIGLGEYLCLGRGEERSGGRDKASILSDAFEALTGAVYLDGGHDVAEGFIRKFVIAEVAAMSLLNESKSTIQEYVQKTPGSVLSYTTEPVSGPEHERTFISRLSIDGRLIATGQGHSKKTAEQDAAARAILHLGITGKNPAAEGTGS